MNISEAIVKDGVLRRGAHDPQPSGGPVWMIQKALNITGADLVMDGDFGRSTETAVIRFKVAHGYAARGDVGPLTASLFDAELQKGIEVKPLASVLDIAPWLTVQRAITGTKELSGAKDSPIIMEWVGACIERYPELAPGMRGYTHDSIPWCGLDQAYCFAKAGFRPPLEPLYATNWFYHWADGVALKEPAIGAVMVKTRQGGGHVTQYEGEDSTHWFCRGGNQSDMVNVARFPKANTKVLGWMWPKNYPVPVNGRRYTNFANAVSVREA